MLTETIVRDIVKAKIAQDENLGKQVGGSGHLGHISYEIAHISKPEKIQTDGSDIWRITYTYTMYVETEFTYYPDNPPYEYQYEKIIFVNSSGKIVRESKKTCTKNPEVWSQDKSQTSIDL